jgi:hypothetical protein
LFGRMEDDVFVKGWEVTLIKSTLSNLPTSCLFFPSRLAA